MVPILDVAFSVFIEKSEKTLFIASSLPKTENTFVKSKYKVEDVHF